MLDLDAGVHLDEVELAVLVQELERAGAAVADRAAGLDAAVAHELALPRGDAGGGRFFDDLLVAPLHRAVALAQVDHVAVGVRQHLEFDVPRPLQEFLHVDLVVAEGGARLGARDADRVQERRLGVHHAHAAPAAAAGGLDDHRIADVARDAQILVRRPRPAGRRSRARTARRGTSSRGSRRPCRPWCGWSRPSGRRTRSRSSRRARRSRRSRTESRSPDGSPPSR